MRTLLIALLLTLPAMPQVVQRRPVVRASGEGIVSVRPDQVKVRLSVTTNANTAAEAADLNASETTKVMAALRQALGANTEIRTTGYSLGQRYNPDLRRNDGFTATNSIEVTVNDLSLAGRAIDTAAGAGATTIGGIQFTLKDSAPSRAQALRLATMQAKANAEAIASGLGKTLGTVMVAQEGSSVSVTPIDIRTTAGLGAGAPTPVEAGNVDVRAYVAVEAEMQ
ncbi:MAG: SIMPL domain-containing protein [Acidobacteria bacterium]|nr:SIMPL domain-containing protein [Acidobacteriota bacterium]